MDDRTDDYQRGDLRGIVFNVQGDMVGVRFLDGRVSHSMRLVTTAEGLLKIDPSGLPVVRDERQSSLDDDRFRELSTGQRFLPAAKAEAVDSRYEEEEEDVVDSELVEEYAAGDLVLVNMQFVSKRRMEQWCPAQVVDITQGGFLMFKLTGAGAPSGIFQIMPERIPELVREVEQDG